MRRASGCAPRPAALTTASNSKFAGVAARELHVPGRRLEAHPLDTGFECDHAAAVLQLAPQRQHEAVAVDDAGLARPQRADAGQFGFHGARGVAADHLGIFHAVRFGLRPDGLDLGQLGVVGGDDQLAAFLVRHVVPGAEFVQHAPAAHAVVSARAVGRIIQAAVNHLAVARRHAVGDAARCFGNDHVVAAQRCLARDREPDDTGADNKDLHCLCNLPRGPGVPERAGAL